MIHLDPAIYPPLSLDRKNAIDKNEAERQAIYAKTAAALSNHHKATIQRLSDEATKIQNLLHTFYPYANKVGYTRRIMPKGLFTEENALSPTHEHYGNVWVFDIITEDLLVSDFIRHDKVLIQKFGPQARTIPPAELPCELRLRHSPDACETCPDSKNCYTYQHRVRSQPFYPFRSAWPVQPE